ncbi:MAG: hypothetical protein IH820_07040 [Bacteroidetes bacterium]|nr:hypothetical protein [Bacteroidota bacterium]
MKRDIQQIQHATDKMHQLLGELLDNAVKFMGDQPEPRIEIGMCGDDGEVVCFARDNGIGIDPKYHEKVFGLIMVNAVLHSP